MEDPQYSSSFDIMPAELIHVLVRLEVNLAATCWSAYNAFLYEYKEEILAWKEWKEKMNGLKLDPLRTRWAIQRAQKSASKKRLYSGSIERMYMKWFIYEYVNSFNLSRRYMQMSITDPLMVDVVMNEFCIAFKHSEGKNHSVSCLIALTQLVVYDEENSISSRQKNMHTVTSCEVRNSRGNIKNIQICDVNKDIMVYEDVYECKKYSNCDDKLFRIVDECGDSGRILFGVFNDFDGFLLSRVSLTQDCQSMDTLLGKLKIVESLD